MDTPKYPSLCLVAAIPVVLALAANAASSALQAQVEALTGDLEAANAASAAWQAQVEALAGDLNAANAVAGNLGSVNRALNSARQQIRAAEWESAQQALKSDSLMDQVDSLLTELRVADAEKDALSADVASLSADLAEAQRQNSALTRQYHAAQQQAKAAAWENDQLARGWMRCPLRRPPSPSKTRLWPARTRR